MGNMRALGTLRRAAFQLAAWQVAITGVVVVIAAWTGGSHDAFSAGVGGSIGIVAGLYQALRLFRVDASHSMSGFLRTVYVAEGVKIVLTVALFIVAIRTLNVDFGPTIIAYAATYLVYWAALKTGYPWLTELPGSGAHRAGRNGI